MIMASCVLQNSLRSYASIADNITFRNILHVVCSSPFDVGSEVGGLLGSVDTELRLKPPYSTSCFTY